MNFVASCAYVTITTRKPGGDDRGRVYGRVRGAGKGHQPRAKDMRHGLRYGRRNHRS